MVVNRVKPGQRRTLEDQVVKLALAEEVQVDSLPVLALLSCVYDASSQPSHRLIAMPRRAVLKPSMSYSAQDAYNALADMLSIELMVVSQALFPEDKPVLYTRDLGLAAFWTALQPNEKTVTHNAGGKVSTTITFNLGAGLFPALSENELLELRSRLAAAHGSAW